MGWGHLSKLLDTANEGVTREAEAIFVVSELADTVRQAINKGVTYCPLRGIDGSFCTFCFDRT